MTPTPYALAPSVRGEATGPDFRELLDPEDQTDADELARIERTGGPFREDGRDWLVELYQELLDAYGYALAHLAHCGRFQASIRESRLAWATVHNLHDRCDAMRRRIERRNNP